MIKENVQIKASMASESTPINPIDQKFGIIGHATGEFGRPVVSPLDVQRGQGGTTGQSAIGVPED